MKTYKGIVRSELNFDSFTGSKNCNFRAVIQFLFSHSYLLSGQLSLFLVPDQRRAVALSRVPVNIHVPLFSRLVCCLFSFFPVNAALPRYPTSPPSFVYKWHLSHRRPPPPPPPPTSNPSKGIYLAVVGYATCQITGKEPHRLLFLFFFSFSYLLYSLLLLFFLPSLFSFFFELRSLTLFAPCHFSSLFSATRLGRKYRGWISTKLFSLFARCCVLGEVGSQGTLRCDEKKIVFGSIGRLNDSWLML